MQRLKQLLLIKLTKTDKTVLVSELLDSDN